ncbi:hypothetical protein WJX84_005048 [Apatococcus fuscideae]|uniref:Glycoside hydrolase family 38 N-terminal domain-containing protein n=1 Tax=Apatococcus fuscideae TaxID=2026836 RepID=A0AAW1S0M0_9CHLO
MKFPVVVQGLLLLTFCSLASRAATYAAKIKYNTSAVRDPGKLNVHLVPHTHDDAGWLKTVDQYYYGSETKIQLAGVEYILDTLVNELWANKDRRFSYGEMAFFSMWWERQDEEIQDRVKQLVDEGRLDFINGGWVQHDEAAAHYVAMIDQTTRGHRFLKETFNFTPRIGWQIDPFGHSSTHASLMCGALGFDGLFFGRADYQGVFSILKASTVQLLELGDSCNAHLCVTVKHAPSWASMESQR